MRNLMFDLETLGRQPGCGIIEIGWCCFSDKEVKVSESFGHVIPVEQSLLYGLSTEKDTVRWWLEQQKGFPPLINERTHITLPQVLSDVASQWNELWFAGVQKLWSKPSLFDIPILNTAFDYLDIERPIILRAENFWRWRDMMTMLDIEQPSKEGMPMVAKLTAHRARADALDQAQRLSRILSLQSLTVRRVNDSEMTAMYNNTLIEQNKRQAKRLKEMESSLARLRGRKQRRTKSRNHK